MTSDPLTDPASLYRDPVGHLLPTQLGRPPVVGVVGADVPRELVLAAGAHPLRLPGRAVAPESRRDELRDEADRLLGAVDAYAVEVLASFLAGELDTLAGLVFCRDRDASLKLYYVVRELARTRPGAPPVHLVDLVHLPRPSSHTYNRAQVRHLLDVLQQWTGRQVGSSDVGRAVRATASARARLRRLEELRASGHVSGTEALHLYSAAETLEPDRAEATVSAWLEQAEQRAPSPAAALFVSGSPHADDRVYSAIEQSGWRVAGEDHDRGSLALTIDVVVTAGDDLPRMLDVLADAYGSRGPDSPTAPAEGRAAWTMAARARSRSAAILSYVRRHDEAPLWDLPRLRDAARAARCPLAELRDQAEQPDLAALAGALHVLDTAGAVTP